MKVTRLLFRILMLTKYHFIFQGMFQKIVLKISEVQTVQSITNYYTENWLHHKYFLQVLLKFLKLLWVLCGETNSKVACLNFCILQFCWKLYHSIIGMFQKVVLLKISKNSILTGNASLQHTGILLKTNS